jgi:hypothetical protein
LKKSPLQPVYQTSNKKVQNTSAELADFAKDSTKSHIDSDGQELHKFKFFYDKSFLDVPEFCFENKIEAFKQKDIDILVEHLKQEEDEAAKKKKAAEDALAA